MNMDERVARVSRALFDTTPHSHLTPEEWEKVWEAVKPGLLPIYERFARAAIDALEEPKGELAMPFDARVRKAKEYLDSKKGVSKSEIRCTYARMEGIPAEAHLITVDVMSYDGGDEVNEAVNHAIKILRDDDRLAAFYLNEGYFSSEHNPHTPRGWSLSRSEKFILAEMPGDARMIENKGQLIHLEGV